MTCHFQLNFYYLIPSNVQVETLDYNLRGNEFCFFFDFKHDQTPSKGLCEYHFTIWVPDEHAAKITAISTFALDDGRKHVDERVSGIRYLKDREEFETICNKMVDDPSLTQDLRVETSLSEIWDGEQKYL